MNVRRKMNSIDKSTFAIEIIYLLIFLIAIEDKLMPMIQVNVNIQCGKSMKRNENAIKTSKKLFIIK